MQIIIYHRLTNMHLQVVQINQGCALNKHNCSWNLHYQSYHDHSLFNDMKRVYRKKWSIKLITKLPSPSKRGDQFLFWLQDRPHHFGSLAFHFQDTLKLIQYVLDIFYCACHYMLSNSLKGSGTGIISLQANAQT